MIKDEINFEAMGLTLDQIIVLSVAGSHMYGTDTKNSDRDYLGVYMPTARQLLLNDYPKSLKIPKEHNPNNLDLQIWSIHYFIKLATSGETMTIDLLHAPEDCIVSCDPNIWYDLVGNRKRFYNKRMKAFVGYARNHASKYSSKGTRIEAIEKVINFLKEQDPDAKIREYWGDLPKGKHIHFLDYEKPFRMYQIKAPYMIEQLQKPLTEYGHRANLAKENKGIDWKAISHALRATYQLYDILKFGDYEYPLRLGSFVKGVKQGKFDFLTVVQPALDDSLNDLEELLINPECNLPDETDKEYWNKWLMNLMKEYVLWML
jgi:predicted nucleotidyltransferase